MEQDRPDYKWLERHINSASDAVSSWPAWKARGSTLDSDAGNIDQQGSALQAKPSAPDQGAR